MTKLILPSISISLIATIISMICGILFGAIFFRIMGPANFGIYGMVQLIVSIYALLEFSLSPFIIRELSKIFKSDRIKIYEYVFFSLFFGFFLSVFAAFVLMLTTTFAIKILAPDKLSDVYHLIPITSLLLFAIMLQIFVSAFFYAFHLQHLAMIFNSIIWVLRIGVGFVFIKFEGNQILRLVEAQIISMFFVIIIEIVYLIRTFKVEFSFIKLKNSFQVSKFILLDYLKFARQYYSATLLGLFFSSLDRIIFVRLFSSYEFGCYILAKNIVMGMYAIMQAIGTHAYPLFSSQVKDSKELIKTYFTYQSILSILFLPIITVFLISSDKIMFYYSGNFQDGILASWYLLFLIYGVFSTVTGSLAQTLVVANRNEKIFFISNLVMLIFVSVIFCICESLKYYGLIVPKIISNIFLVTFAIVPLIGSVISLYSVHRTILPNLIKKVVFPVWILPFSLAFVLSVFQLPMIKNDLVYSTIVFALIIIFIIMMILYTKKTNLKLN